MKQKPEINRVFIKRLRQAFVSSGIDATVFCKMVGIGRSTFYDYMNGIRVPRMDILKSFCKILNVSSDWLLGLSDVKEIKHE